jgi:hypothetical protein
VNILPAVARYLLNFNPKIQTIRSLELGGVILGSPKRSTQELKEVARRHKDAADALAVEKRDLLDESEEKVPLIYMHVLLFCAADVGAVCVYVFVFPLFSPPSRYSSPTAPHVHYP